VRSSDLTHRLKEASMSASTRLTRRTATVLAALLIALVALPSVAGARPTYEGPGYQLPAPSESSTPADTVVRTIIKEEPFRVLPIALAGAALIIAIAGSGYTIARTAPLRQQLPSQH
jgi:hypothetical protein